MNEEILKKYEVYLRDKHGKKNTIDAYTQGITHLARYLKKPLEQATLDEVIAWKSTLVNQNTQRTFSYSVNTFFRWLGKPDLHLTIPKGKLANKQVFSIDERDRFLKTAEENPLDNMVALLLYDSILRPDEIINIKHKDIDFENHVIYLDKTKVNSDVPALMSPRLEKAIRDYLSLRPRPNTKMDAEYLIIQGKGCGRGSRLKTTYGIRTITSRIALRAGIQRKVTPYKTVKPSALTLRFNDKVNPQTLQRLARHRDILSTLIYDHSNDEDALRYLKNQSSEKDFTNLSPKQKAQVLLDRLFKGEIDQHTFDAGLELLKPDFEIEQKSQRDVGYA